MSFWLKQVQTTHCLLSLQPYYPYAIFVIFIQFFFVWKILFVKHLLKSITTTCKFWCTRWLYSYWFTENATNCIYMYVHPTTALKIPRNWSHQDYSYDKLTLWILSGSSYLILHVIILSEVWVKLGVECVYNMYGHCIVALSWEFMFL